MKFFFSIKYRYSIYFFMTFIVECCSVCFAAIKLVIVFDMISMTSTARYQSPRKVASLCTAEVESTELADMRSDCLTPSSNSLTPSSTSLTPSTVASASRRLAPASRREATASRHIRGSFFMFVESGCISTNIEFTVP